MMAQDEEQKKKYNGWLKFYEHGFVGIKDRDEKVIVDPSLGYTDIGDLKDFVAIAKKNGKCGLIDIEGKPLCPFIYDQLVFIGEGCYKAGLLQRPNDGLVVEYADTSHVYEILDAEGKVLCSRDKGFNYVSEACCGEVTVSINGQCGIADFQGNILVPLQHKYIQPMGDELYLVSYHGSDNYWATIVDRSGNVMIPAEMHYRDIHRFYNGAAVALQDGKWGLIDKHGNHIAEFDFNYAEEWGEGYFKVESGAKKNIMRPDGSLVLTEWHNDVFKVNNGFFLFSNTIRKSKTNPKTRYTYGLAHVNGDIIFPMIFDHAYWMKDNWGVYAEIGTKPYVLTPLGSVYDPERSHLPKRISINFPDLIEKFANWTMPGLQFYYRDTDALDKAEDTYHVGDIVRGGFFIDVTTKLLRPTTKTRFLIASAHAAPLCEIDDLCRQNPNVKKWGMNVLHPNSYFKVMDVYKVGNVTQVFLLHIPPTAAILVGRSEMVMKFINEATGSEHTLIGMARKSLDEKVTMDVHPRSLDKEWVERTAHPVGLDDELHPLSLNAVEEPDDPQIVNMSNMIHKLAHDEDIEGFFELDDNFPWEGVEGSVCEGCIYARGIVGKGEGCGRLFQKSFRERYVKGRCEYKKAKLSDESRFDRQKRQERETAEKQSDVYALRLVNEFVKEVLQGDVNKLSTFDFSTISDNKKYGDMQLARAPIVRAIMALVFNDAWPTLNVDNLIHYTYWCDSINHFQQLFGANILDQYFKGMQKFNPTPAQHQRAVKVAHLTNHIGNVWVLPNKDTLYRCKEQFRGYVDQMLKAMYVCMIDGKRQNRQIKGALYTNRKLMVDYQGEEGFKKFIQNMMLEDYVDENGLPKDVFMGVWSMMKELDGETYFKAVDEYCSFMESFVPRRGERIVQKLKQIMSNN